MMLRHAAAAAVLAATAATASAPASAANFVPYPGVGQHARVMNNIYRAQQRNNAAIAHVQNNIRSTRPKTY